MLSILGGNVIVYQTLDVNEAYTINYGTPLLPYSIVYLECLAKLLLRRVTWSIQGMQISLCYVKISLTMGIMTFYFMPILLYIPSCSILRLVKHAITSCQYYKP
mgnify:CR=1 FL=1